VRRNLIIIPGLGDHALFYSFLKLVWAALGFKTYVFSYRWEDAPSNDLSMGRLLSYIDSNPDELFYIIGASAGGTAAINALIERPERITRIATVCTPYDVIPHARNLILRQSIVRLIKNLKRADIRTKHNILSVYARSDSIVNPQLSRYPTVVSKELPVSGHALTIFLAMTLWSPVIKKHLLLNTD
jgi:pimeloyl-ACP methyl ester carboxylesterase